VLLFVLLMQSLLCLQWGELVSKYPLAGGLYQWATHVGGPFLGLLAGVVYLAFFVLALGPIGLVATAVLKSLIASFNDTRAAELIIGSVIIAGSGIVLGLKLKVLAYVNAAGVIAEMIVLVGAGIALLFNTNQTLSVLFHTAGHGFTAGTAVLAMIFVIPALSGFELGGSFAEETVHAQRTTAHAIVRAAVGAGGAFVFFLFAATLASEDLGSAAIDPGAFVPGALGGLGEFAADLFLVSALVALVSTVMATLAGISRLVFGMSRDGLFPGSPILRRQARSGEPTAAIVFVTVLCLMPQFLPSLGVIVAATGGMSAFAYLLVVSTLGRRRLEGWPHEPAPYSLGRLGPVLNAVAVAWLTFVVIENLVPRAATNPDLGPLPVLWEILGGVILVCVAWWFLAVRNAQPSGDAPDVMVHQTTN
jgi:amino acid transporter